MFTVNVATSHPIPYKSDEKFSDWGL